MSTTELSTAFEKKCDCCGKTELTKERYAWPWLYAEFSSTINSNPREFCGYDCFQKWLEVIVNNGRNAWVRMYWYEAAK